MQVYIANLGKYNEGELVGAWFKPPIDIENVKEQIGLNGEYDDYGHWILPPFPCYLPSFAKEFTTQCQHDFQF